MDNTNPPPNSSDDLNFDKVDDGGAAPKQSGCALCHQPLTYQYYEVNQQVVCPPCKDKFEEQMEQAKGAGRYIKAFLFGLPAGIVGAGIYYAIVALTGYELGLISILIGYMVGLAVRYGSNHRGSIGLQIMAALITYCSICSTYVPFIIGGIQDEFHMEEMMFSEEGLVEEDVTVAKEEIGSMTKDEAEEITSGVITDEDLAKFDRYSPAGGVTTIDDIELDPDAPQITDPAPETSVGDGEFLEDATISQLILGYLFVFILALIAPWLAGVSNIIGWLIIGFGVYQAWVMNKYVPLEFKGPFDIKRR